MTIAFTLNGTPVAATDDPDMPLLWFIRDRQNLTGTKFGCGAGLCGACTVLVDGEAQRSCVLPLAAVEGQTVTTIEAATGDAGPSAVVARAVTAAWIEAQVPQCGYCQSGMILAATALLAANPAPSDADIDVAMTNICRCGTYPRIRKAIHRAAALNAGTDTEVRHG